MAEVDCFGGYDCEFVEPVPERLKCTVCTKVMRDPHLMACCGEKFCNTCLVSWFTRKNMKANCPHCRAKKVRNSQLHVPEKGMKREIESLHIHCSYCKDGCKWKGELRECNKHLTSDNGCDYHRLECPNACETGAVITTVRSKELKSHLQLCPMRREPCQHCGMEGVVKDHHAHLRDCDMLPIKCPNGCGETGIVRQMRDPHLLVCRLEAVECGYAHVGCMEKIPRGDMTSHLEFSQGKHLEMATAECTRLREKCQEAQENVQIVLADKLSEVTSMLEATKEEHYLDTQDLHRTIKGQERQIETVKKELENVTSDLAKHLSKCATNELQLQVQERKRVVLKDLELIKINQLYRQTATLSIETQFRTPFQFSDEPLYLRMLDVDQILANKKEWNSPGLNLSDAVKVCLNVSCRESPQRMRLELRLLRGSLGEVSDLQPKLTFTIGLNTLQRACCMLFTWNSLDSLIQEHQAALQAWIIDDIDAIDKYAKENNQSLLWRVSRRELDVEERWERERSGQSRQRLRSEPHRLEQGRRDVEGRDERERQADSRRRHSAFDREETPRRGEYRRSDREGMADRGREPPTRGEYRRCGFGREEMADRGQEPPPSGEYPRSGFRGGATRGFSSRGQAHAEKREGSGSGRARWRQESSSSEDDDEVLF